MPKTGASGSWLFRQEDRDIEHGSSHSDISEKLTHLSTDDISLTDWQLGFHIYLVFLICLYYFL